MIEELRMLDQPALDRLLGRNLLTTQEWSRADLDTLRGLARAHAALDRAGVDQPLCPQPARSGRVLRPVHPYQERVGPVPRPGWGCSR